MRMEWYADWTPGSRWLFALLMALGLALAPGPYLALAHGGGAPVVTREPAGGLLLYAWIDPASPRGGELVHVTIGVTQLDAAGAEVPIADAAVSVRAVAEGRAAQQVSAAPGASAGGVYYEADMELEEGLYTLEVEVTPLDDAANGGMVAFPLSVLPPAGTTWWLIWLGSAAVVLGVVLYVVAIVRGRRKVVVPQ